MPADPSTSSLASPPSPPSPGPGPEPPRRPAGRPRRVAALALLLLVLGAGGLLLAGERLSTAAPEQSAAGGPDLLHVRPLTVRLEPGYAVEERYVGRVSSRRTSRLGFTGGGLLVEVVVDEGDEIAPDEVLARLDADELEAARRELEAQVAETRARLELARLTLERTRSLAGKDSVSRQQFDEARLEEVALGARLESARAAIERVEVQIDRTLLRAPYAGRVVGRSADEGTILAPGQEVLRVIESGPLEVRVGVSPEIAERLERGGTHPVEIDGRLWPATVTAILDEVSLETRTVTVVLSVDPGDTALRHGALARLQVETHREAEGFWVPIEALSESRRGLWAAFTLEPVTGEADLHRLERREVTLLHAEAERAFVRGTLRDGERIAASGVHRLVPGQKVRVTPAPAPVSAAARSAGDPAGR